MTAAWSGSWQKRRTGVKVLKNKPDIPYDSPSSKAGCSKENKWNAPEGTSEGFGEDGDVPGGNDLGGGEHGASPNRITGQLEQMSGHSSGCSLARAQSLSGWSCTLFSSTVTACKAVAQLRGVVSHIRATNSQGGG